MWRPLRLDAIRLLWMKVRHSLTLPLAPRYRPLVPDGQQAPPKISVTARDPEELVRLLRERSYQDLADAVGVSKTYVGELGVGHRVRVSVVVAQALETELGRKPGELFCIDPAVADATRPYLQ